MYTCRVKISKIVFQMEEFSYQMQIMATSENDVMQSNQVLYASFVI